MSAIPLFDLRKHPLSCTKKKGKRQKKQKKTKRSRFHLAAVLSGHTPKAHDVRSLHGARRLRGRATLAPRSNFQGQSGRSETPHLSKARERGEETIQCNTASIRNEKTGWSGVAATGVCAVVRLEPIRNVSPHTSLPIMLRHGTAVL